MPNSVETLPPRPLRRLARRAMVAAQPALRHSGMSVRVGRALERRRAAVYRDEESPAVGPDGLPIPPAALRVANVNSPDLELFFSYGERTANAIAEIAERHGTPISQTGSLLDFGCGCGRVLRNWNREPGLRVCGSDLNPDAIAWLGSHLPFVSANHNGLAPPLPYGDAEFGLIYAISVFTHLTEDLGEAWMTELYRVLRPGGLLIFSINGSSLLEFLTKRERAAFHRGEMVVQFKEAAGENICAAYHPEAYLQGLTRAFDCLERMPATSTGFIPQDVWVVRRPK